MKAVTNDCGWVVLNLLVKGSCKRTYSLVRYAAVVGSSYLSSAGDFISSDHEHLSDIEQQSTYTPSVSTLYGVSNMPGQPAPGEQRRAHYDDGSGDDDDHH